MNDDRTPDEEREPDRAEPGATDRREVGPPAADARPKPPGAAEGVSAPGPSEAESEAETRGTDAPEPQVPTGPTPDTPGNDRMTGRQRLAAGLWPPRLNRNQLIAAALLFVLGLGLAIQVRSTSEDSALRGARQEDLVRILDELDDRTTRLEDEKQRLETQRSELENSSDQAEEARQQREERERQLGILAGTVAAQGPGIEVRISGPADVVEADRLLDAIQELRAAGAEAMQINDVRVVADTYFTNAEGGVNIDGQSVSPPYVFEVIGRPQDLEPALNIPGGVVQSLQGDGATVTITPSDTVVVDALRSAQRPDYAQSPSQ
ncbi:DUF881 domain-containing protein [Streptomyces chumphonensis]|uniref:DUF881 domain-containing protein n=1 Tax=Streptomyces chumphonensis TaxID=1214925 RepID=A0A927IEX0_9ACTN|nr:DUF881 domain-containing protein [Streptomyces chumphonensis]MBD3933811.1 DUF881 domain-containing protein [Streptomyces chumphonensis]